MSDENFSILGVDESPESTKVWKILLYLGIVGVILLIISLALCGVDEQCRNHIPTMSNMLNTTISTPYVVSATNAGLVIHLITVLCLFAMTRSHVYLWSWAQLFTAFFVYLTVIVTLLVLPFTGWEKNWAVVCIIVALVLWMIVVMLCLWRYYGRKLARMKNLLRFNLLFFVIFLLCSIVYITLRSVHSLHIVPRDDGILVVEIVGGISFALFLGLCVLHIGKLEIQIRDQ